MIIFRNIQNDAVMRALAAGELDEDAMLALTEFAELGAVGTDVLCEYVITLLVNDDNTLARVISAGKTPGASLTEAACSELVELLRLIGEHSFDYIPSGKIAKYFSLYEKSILDMCAAKSAPELFKLLCGHYGCLGVGDFGRYIAFMQKEDGISPIESPDTMSFDRLVGLEHIKKVLCDNCELLLGGKAANNVLLFGDRGTGKSSCVKALLNMYCGRGLRVIEIPKSAIGKIPALFSQVGSKPQKFILYLDDLSFEKHETEYRSLKVAMDGQLGVMPKNVIICATSNRRHLIKENWKDREGGDVHANDNMQEMLSLSERFGISLVFAAPNQREYLDIVAKLLEKRGIEINSEIEQQAIVWQMNYGGRTPRCAAQFAQSYAKGK